MKKIKDDNDIKIINYTKFHLKDDQNDPNDFIKFYKLIKNAYKKLKLASYYEKYPLNYRLQLSQFESESDDDPERKLEEIAKILFPLTKFEIKLENDFQDLKDTVELSNLHKYFSDIDYLPFPKKVTSPLENNQNNGDINNSSIQLFSNNNIDINYFLESYELFFATKTPTSYVIFQIISILWIEHIGVVLDSDLDLSCYGSRIRHEFRTDPYYSYYIFYRYFEKYADWRDKSINTAERLLNEENRDSVIIALDITRFYYSLDINFDSIINDYWSILNIKYPNIKDEIKNDLYLFINNLNIVLKFIHKRFIDCIPERLLKKILSPDDLNKEISIPNFLPIGLLSSSIIANNYLKKVDKAIIKSVNPDYYGRYIDDILIVLKSSDFINDVLKEKIHNSEKIEKIILEYFSGSKIITLNKNFNADGKNFLVIDPNPSSDILKENIPLVVYPTELKVQLEKIKIFHFERNSSRAVLNKIKKSIQQNSSFFKFLPDDVLDKKFDTVVYNIVTKGSSQKIRTIVDITEDEYELVKYLTQLLLKYRFSSSDSIEIKNDIQDIFYFFNGLNVIKYFKLMERVFSLFVITERIDEIELFYDKCSKEIKKIKLPEKDENLDEIFIDLLKRIVKTLLDHLSISFSMSFGLLPLNNQKRNIYLSKKYSKTIANHSIFNNYTYLKNSEAFRKSNLIRDQYELFPLINLIIHEDLSLTLFKDIYQNNIKFKEEKLINLSFPSKIYHLWEYLILLHYIYFVTQKINYQSLFQEIIPEDKLHYNNLKSINSKKPKILPQSLIIDKIALHNQVKVLEDYPENNEYIELEEYFLPNEKNKDKIKIGIGHLQTDDIHLKSNLDPRGGPIITLEREISLNNILNSAVEQNCDILIFPELSIPYYWLPYMVSFTKRNQIGLIFGLEHWMNEDDNKNIFAHNLVVTALPFKIKGKYHDCLLTIRNKNHYPCSEERSILESGKKVPKNPNKALYHLFHWRGVSFTVFNCFELADINHKSFFKSKIDLLIAIEYNKDTNYYSNIVESISRDLHCYVTQVNIPKYGDSRVIQPKKTELMNLARITGGQNSVLLTTTIDIKALRDFQLKKNICCDGDFKPLPPGFDSNQVLKRGKLDNTIEYTTASIWVKKMSQK